MNWFGSYGTSFWCDKGSLLTLRFWFDGERGLLMTRSPLSIRSWTTFCKWWYLLVWWYLALWKVQNSLYLYQINFVTLGSSYLISDKVIIWALRFWRTLDNESGSGVYYLFDLGGLDFYWFPLSCDLVWIGYWLGGGCPSGGCILVDGWLIVTWLTCGLGGLGYGPLFYSF